MPNVNHAPTPKHTHRRAYTERRVCARAHTQYQPDVYKCSVFVCVHVWCFVGVHARLVGYARRRFPDVERERERQRERKRERETDRQTHTHTHTSTHIHTHHVACCVTKVGTRESARESSAREREKELQRVHASSLYTRARARVLGLYRYPCPPFFLCLKGVFVLACKKPVNAT